MQVLLRISCVLALAVTINASAVPFFETTTGGRIVLGEPAAVGQFPWQVAVHFTRSNGNFFCGGSIISDSWVLTAAHCAHTTLNYTLRFGGLTLNAAGEDGRLDVQASTSIVHADYNDNLNNDIALIKLDSPIEFTNRIQPARLPARGERQGAGEPVTVSGWGRISDGSPGVSQTLNFVQITTISNEKCAETYGNGIVIDSTVCMVGNPNEGSCNGDSGGPLVHYDDEGVATQVALVSFGHIDGCETHHPSGFVRVESFLPWIADQTGLDV